MESTLSVIYEEGKGHLKILLSHKFKIHDELYRKAFNLERDKNEEMGKSLARLSANIKKFYQKKMGNKNKKSTVNNDIDIALYKGSNKMDTTLSNEEAWLNAEKLIIDNDEYKVMVNPPQIITAIFPKLLMKGFMVYPTIDVQFMEKKECLIEWYKAKKLNSQENATSKDITLDKFKHMHTGCCYMPVDDDVGYYIKICCTPKRGDIKGCSVEVVSQCTVASYPGDSPLEKRYLQIQGVCSDNSMRVVTYNLLKAMVTEDEEYNIPYSHCSKEYLASKYRRLLITRELPAYQADVICLQEVDLSFYKKELTTCMELNGLTGHFMPKTYAGQGGEAIFYRKEKIRFVTESNICIADELMKNVDNEEIYKNICKIPELKQYLTTRRTVLQTLVLETRDLAKSPFIVANTHLAGYPQADNSRLVQAEVCIRHLESLRQKYQTGDIPPAVIFAGDFNSDPLAGVHYYIINQHIPADFRSWFSYGREQFMNIELRHSLPLISACGTPLYTHLLNSSHGCIDFIYIDKEQFEVSKVIDLPDHQDIIRYTCLPNKMFPSDHLSLVCELKWR